MLHDAPDGCTVNNALAWERSESDQSSANTPVTSTRTDGGHRKRDEGRKFEAPSKIESRRGILPSISGDLTLPHSQWLLCLRVPKCEADSKAAGRGHHRPLT
jgi:hypothetical protein